MKIKKIVPKKNTSVKEGLIVNSIVKYLDVSKFPRNLVLGKLKIKNKELLEKNNKADIIIKKINETIQNIITETENIDKDNHVKKTNLKEKLS